MNRHLKELIVLAKNDQAIDSYLPQIEAAQKKITKAQKRVEVVQEEIDTLQNAIQENEAKVRAFEEQIRVLKQQLDSNAKKTKEISTEREMQALSLEEDLAKEKLSFANNEISRLQKINETKKSLIEETAKRLEEAQHAFVAIGEVVESEKAEIEKSKSELFIKRQELSKNIEQKILAFYEKIRNWAGNTAVVSVKKQACYGCYMKVNDKTYAEVIKAEEIINCPHCGRILYIDQETLA